MESNKRLRKARTIESEYLPSDIKMLIQLVEPRRLLWDPSHENYKDRKIREREFHIIAKEMNRTIEDCKAKWENLRAQYRTCHMKSVQNISIKWKYYESLSFLHTIYKRDNKTKDYSMDFDLHSATNPGSTEALDIQSDSHLLEDLDTNSSLSSPLPTRTIQKSKNEMPQPLVSNQTIAAQEQIRDSAQIFGDFVADQMRLIKPHLAADLKTNILKLVIEALEKNI